MKKFSDFAIKLQGNRKVFNCPQVSITDLTNIEIEVLDFIPDIKTEHGEGRVLVLCRHEGQEKKFFTNSSDIKEALSLIPGEDFPFTTVIKAIKMGNGKIYRFT
jgi:hypothetical protein